MRYNIKYSNLTVKGKCTFSAESTGRYVWSITKIIWQYDLFNLCMKTDATQKYVRIIFSPHRWFSTIVQKLPSTKFCSMFLWERKAFQNSERIWKSVKTNMVIHTKSSCECQYWLSCKSRKTILMHIIMFKLFDMLCKSIKTIYRGNRTT